MEDSTQSVLERRQNECEFDHHKRLVYGKLVDKTLADFDYAELSQYVYGKEYSCDVSRRMLYGSCKTLQLLEDQTVNGITGDDVLSELDARRIELQKDRQKMFDQRTALNKLIRERARQEELNEILLDVVGRGNLPQLDYEPSCTVSSDNDILVSLNDIHYGANVNNYWTKYDSDICRDMMRRYLDRVIEIGQLHNCENCIVWENGDCISGSIHHSIAVTNKENVIEQVVGVSELISEFLAELSRHFTMVQFVSVSGNHSRMDTKDRSLKDERLDDLIEWYLSARLQNFDNVIIGGCDKVDSTMYLIDIRGKTYCGVHGDYDGSASKVQALQTMARRPLYCVLSGHLHHCRVDEVQGIKTVMAGSFLGMDDFCISKRIYGRPEQMVCICDESGIKCSYNIDLS